MNILNPEAYLHAANWLAKQDRDYLTPAERQTLLVLAGFSNPKGQAWPTISTIADRVGASEKTIQRALRKLEHRRLIQTNRNPMTSDTRIISEDILPPLQTDPVHRSSCPPITNNSIDELSKEDNQLTVVVGQIDGGEVSRRYPTRRELSTHARLPCESRKLIRPLVDHFIDALVAIGKKKPKWAATDKIADDWHWFIFDAVINHEVYRGGTSLQPDDELWFEIIEQAIYELAKDNQKSILPDKRLTEAIVKVRAGYEQEIRGREEEGHQQEKGQEGSGQADQKNPKLRLASEQLAVFKEREAQQERYDESLPHFSCSPASSMSGD